ncbi:hypothetical protein AMTRI_Chr12g268110 [Amborella trichopoda]
MAWTRRQSHLSILSFIIAVLFGPSLCSLPEKIPVAFFIFGDSTVDVGNNNYIKTVPENQAGFQPYGNNGVFGGPTGRFSDGRVIVDFIAQYAKLPNIPAFLEPSAEFVHGVNFASGGAGILPETHQNLAIDLRKQLENFEEVQRSLSEKLGDAQAEDLISNAVYFISMGSNDYMGGYVGNPLMQQSYSPQQYVGMVIGNLTNAIQGLYQKGARKFGFLGLSPLGCLPALRAVNPNPNNNEGGCFEDASALAQAHNGAISTVLRSLEHHLKGFKHANSNFYNWLADRMINPAKYGFKEGVVACCGTGPFKGTYSCGGTRTVKEFELCDSPKSHVWWDSFHPTEGIHEQFALELWGGAPQDVGPYNLEALFNNDLGTTIADIVDKDVDATI